MLGSRYVRGVTVVLALFVFAHGAWADDVTLRMKDGDFEIRGSLLAYNGDAYVIRSPELGILEINARHYECLGGACPSANTSGATGTLATPEPPTSVTAPTTAAAQTPTAPAQPNLGTATFIGGSAIGSRFMPELITSYAADRGLIVEKSLGTDIRDINFKLTDTDGNERGRVSILNRGATAGLRALLDNEANMVFASRRISETEVAAFAPQGFDMRAKGNEHIFALDALVVLVHKSNPVIALPIDTIARIFAGEITDWGELGREPGTINVYAPDAQMGTWIAFEDAILKPRGLSLSPDARRLPTAIEWSDAVAEDANGIGFNMLAFVRDAKPLNIQQSCGLSSRPSVFSAKTEEFPLARRLYFYTKGRPTVPLARELLEFALSPRAQQALKNASFVDQEPELRSFRDQGSRIAFALNAQDDDFRLEVMRQLLSELSGAERLSTTFRFAVGSAFLDTKAEKDVARLAEELSRSEFADREIMLIGFSDSVGVFDINQEVSLARAQTVLNALRQAGFERGVAKAYGELAPVACNDTPESRNLNRRVEVWIK